MTTTSARRPSPADLAARSGPRPQPAPDTSDRTPTVRAPGTPASPAKKRRKGSKASLFLHPWTNSILASSLIPTHRLVALTLATHCVPATGRILPGRQPHIDGLVDETRLTPAQVATALTVLYQRGFLATYDPTAGWEACGVRLTLPPWLTSPLLNP